MSQAPGDGGRSEKLTASTFRGLRWSYLAAAVNGLMQVAYVAAMSRLLDPVAFGLMAIAHLVVNFGLQFARMGVSQAIIQKPQLRPEDIRASVTVGLLAGFGLGGVLWVSAPSIAGLFTEPEATPLLRAMSLSFVLTGLGMTSQGLLRRELRFKELSSIQMVRAVTTLVVGIGAALAGFGVWSLVAAPLTANAVGDALQYERTRHSLRPVLRLTKFTELYAYGARVSLLRLAEFVSKNVDTFAVARLTSTAALGVYNRAYYLVDQPISRYLAGAFTSVLFPGLSRIQQDVPRLQRTYISTLRLTAAVLFPLCAGIAVAAPEIVLVGLGGQWVDAIPLLPWFAGGAAFHIMSRLTELVCEARGKLNGAIALEAVALPTLAGALFAVGALTDALWTFAAVLAAWELLRQVAYTVLMRGVAGVPLGAALSAYGPALVSAVVTAALIGSARLLVAPVWPPLVVLAVELMAGAAGLVLGTRFNPARILRRDLHARLSSAGMLDPRRRRLSAAVNVVLNPDPSWPTHAA